MNKEYIQLLKEVKSKPGCQIFGYIIANLRDGGYIRSEYSQRSRTNDEPRCTDCHITMIGVDALDYDKKSFIGKVFDKQPGTVLQIVVSAIIGFISGSTGGYLINRIMSYIH